MNNPSTNTTIPNTTTTTTSTSTTTTTAINNNKENNTNFIQIKINKNLELLPFNYTSTSDFFKYLSIKYKYNKKTIKLINRGKILTINTNINDFKKYISLRNKKSLILTLQGIKDDDFKHITKLNKNYSSPLSLRSKMKR